MAPCTQVSGTCCSTIEMYFTFRNDSIHLFNSFYAFSEEKFVLAKRICLPFNATFYLTFLLRRQYVGSPTLYTRSAHSVSQMSIFKSHMTISLCTLYNIEDEAQIPHGITLYATFVVVKCLLPVQCESFSPIFRRRHRLLGNFATILR